MKKIYFFAFCLFIMIQGNIVKGQNPSEYKPDVLDRIINIQVQKELGFKKLSSKEREKVASFLMEEFRTTQGDSLERIAVQKMEEDGWKKVKILGKKQIDFNDYLIVEISALSTWLIESPFLSAFPSGYYWARTSPISGIDTMIDNNGREHSFILADKKEL